MRALSAKILFLLAMSWPAVAQPVSCAGVDTSVIASTTDEVRLTCDAVARATTQFQRCNIPPITRPLTIEVIDDIGPGCLGIYHCGQDRIELLAPTAMAARRQADSVLASLPIDRFFQSIVVHELTHAATEDAPCPFAHCLVRDEYIAHVMQIMSLTPEQRHGLLERAAVTGKVSRDELNPFMYFMAPERFAMKAWVHFTQRDDPCGFLGQMLDGTVLLDRERFE